jgi:hypothetical protein
MIQHTGRMDLRMFPPGTCRNHMDAQVIFECGLPATPEKIRAWF